MRMTDIRRCRPDELDRIFAIINEAALAYRGQIPDVHWHEPYMSAAALEQEIAAGVEFWGCDEGGELRGVMGLQSVRDVDLIRHAYVLTAHQGEGIGGKLLEFLRARSGRPMLIGTWAAAIWAIRFYERHGFALASPERARRLLSEYWTVSPAQMDVSVVLVPVSADEAATLLP
jgi:GNAT superfamily N-acetyltransferase